MRGLDSMEEFVLHGARRRADTGCSGIDPRPMTSDESAAVERCLRRGLVIETLDVDCGWLIPYITPLGRLALRVSVDCEVPPCRAS